MAHYPSDRLVMYVDASNFTAECSLTDALPSQPFTVPKDAHDITFLTRTIGICTEKGVVVVDPTKWVTWPYLESSAEVTSLAV